MSIEALKWAFEQEDVPPGPRFVLVALANRADETGYCFPSIRWVCKKTGFADSNVRKYINDLEAIGKLEKTQRRRDDGGKSVNEYRLALDQPGLALGPPPPPAAGGTPPPAAGDTPPVAGGGTASSRRSPPPAAGGHKTKDLDEELRKEEGPALRLVGGKKPPKPGSTTIDGYLEHCKAHGIEPIPLDDPVWDYAEKIGIAADVLHLTWKELVIRYREKGKRQIDWRSVFRSCVRGNWYGLWAIDESRKVVLTSKGRQAQLAHQKAAA